MRTKRFSTLHVILAAVLAAALTLGGCLLGFGAWLGEDGRTVLEGFGLIHDKFVGEYDETELLDATMAGMVAGLGDRWSYYLTQEQYEAQEERRTNVYVGIGVTVSYAREDGLLLDAVTADSPADLAGLQAGEVILSVDGTSLAGENRHRGAELIGRGEAGTEASLEVLGLDGQRRTVAVSRTSLELNPVTYEMLEGDIGYVKLANFYSHSAEKLAASVRDLQSQGAAALVFDMRNNGGGYLSELTDMLDFLLPEGPILRSRDVDGNETVTQSDAACVDLPMAVLVNANTYSAAEFFAAELQEWGVGAIVGEPTSGKGYSQQTFALPGGGAMAISTGAYSTGQGTSLVGTGLTLDRAVEQTGEGDAQLDAAVELLQGR